MNNWTSGKKNIQDLGLRCQSDHQDTIISQPPPVSNTLFICIVKHYLSSGSLFKFSLSCHWILIGRVLSESPCPNISLYEAFHRLGCVSHHRFVRCWAIFVFFNSPRLLSVHYPGKTHPKGHVVLQFFTFGTHCVEIFVVSLQHLLNENNLSDICNHFT